MAELRDTHYVPAFTNPGKFKFAVCGATVTMVQHDAEPSCATCRKWLNDEAADANAYGSVEERAEALFGQPDPATPRMTLNTFSVTQHYTPKGGAR